MRRARPRLAALLLLMLAAACAPPRPLPYPPDVTARLIRFALAEWQDWGCVVLGEPGPPLSPGCAETRPPAAAAEAAPRNFPRVLAYWRAVEDAPQAISLNRARYAALLSGEAPDAPVWSEPFWSAAFISWLMLAAGVDRAEFQPSAAHVFSLDHLDRLAEAHPDAAPFLPRDPHAYAPRPGDLICTDRSAAPLPDWRARAAERGSFRPMHCDLVVASGPGVIEAVGGNIADGVALRRLAADPAGRPRPEQGPILVVMENRLSARYPLALAADRGQGALSAWAGGASRPKLPP
ncbi:MAG: DUF2272 domain-containing protein [Rhodovarius sp.]|nr:DUF2272 domain-containing protein [Rhodovarius sp.]